jgi:hypothetical protein
VNILIVKGDVGLVWGGRPTTVRCSRLPTQYFTFEMSYPKGLAGTNFYNNQKKTKVHVAKIESRFGSFSDFGVTCWLKPRSFFAASQEISGMLRST